MFNYYYAGAKTGVAAYLATVTGNGSATDTAALAACNTFITAAVAALPGPNVNIFGNAGTIKGVEINADVNIQNASVTPTGGVQIAALPQ